MRKTMPSAGEKETSRYRTITIIFVVIGIIVFAALLYVVVTHGVRF
jgi:magnesium-transporting ATPase (P-type)